MLGPVLSFNNKWRLLSRSHIRFYSDPILGSFAWESTNMLADKCFLILLKRKCYRPGFPQFQNCNMQNPTYIWPILQIFKISDFGKDRLCSRIPANLNDNPSARNFCNFFLTNSLHQHQNICADKSSYLVQKTLRRLHFTDILQGLKRCLALFPVKLKQTTQRRQSPDCELTFPPYILL